MNMQISWFAFPVKIYTSVLTIGHYCNKTSVLGLQTITCMCIAFARFYSSRNKDKSVSRLHLNPNNFKDWLIMMLPSLIYNRIHALLIKEGGCLIRKKLYMKYNAWQLSFQHVQNISVKSKFHLEIHYPKFPHNEINITGFHLWFTQSNTKS
jgi:hypothetical protein